MFQFIIKARSAEGRGSMAQANSNARIAFVLNCLALVIGITGACIFITTSIPIAAVISTGARSYSYS